MIIVRDAQGNVIAKQRSQRYISTRKLRERNEQALCEKAIGLVTNERGEHISFINSLGHTVRVCDARVC
jgi:hypothetical protein